MRGESGKKEKKREKRENREKGARSGRKKERKIAMKVGGREKRRNERESRNEEELLGLWSVLPSFTVVSGSEWLSSSLSGAFLTRGGPRG